MRGSSLRGWERSGEPYRDLRERQRVSEGVLEKGSLLMGRKTPETPSGA